MVVFTLVMGVARARSLVWQFRRKAAYVIFIIFTSRIADAMPYYLTRRKVEVLFWMLLQCWDAQMRNIIRYNWYNFTFVRGFGIPLIKSDVAISYSREMRGFVFLKLLLYRCGGVLACACVITEYRPFP